LIYYPHPKDFPHGSPLPQHGLSFPQGVGAVFFPLTMIPAPAEIIRFPSPPHEGHVETGSSLILWKSS
jgi:hypothetical protein